MQRRNTEIMMKRTTITAVCLLWMTVAMATNAVRAAWGTTDERYHDVHQFPENQAAVELAAWRGERVNMQLVVMNEGREEAHVSVSIGQLAAESGETEGEAESEAGVIWDAVRGGFVESVAADGFCGCGNHDIGEYGNRPMPDRISHNMEKTLAPSSLSGVWLTVRVPREARAGMYNGTVEISADGDTTVLAYRLRVVDRVLPTPSDWAFHLDFWQHPYSVARYHGVELWSEEHLNLMRPLMEELAEAGQKVVTTTLTARPWDGQSQDAYESMVTWTRMADSTWSYDFTVFDKWVEFMASCGIDRQINCFSMIPWRLSFEYYDQATGQVREMHCSPGEEAYNTFWGGMLREFQNHLIDKGWLHKTTIAMDERKPEQMMRVMELIDSVAPSLKVSLAGNYHPEIEERLSDYCVDYLQIDDIPHDMIERRRKEGLVTTFYTCCSTETPNTFSFSPPAEAELLPWLAAAYGLDGYLRWAFNNWTEDPIIDSRFRSWPSGDTYIIYPNAETSVRWERLVEGVQQYEKWRILGADQTIVAPLRNHATAEEMLRRMAKARSALNK